MSNFDVANLALQIACGASNELKYDNKQMPSVMVKIPKFTWADVGIGTSTDVFPAFKINGQVVDEIYFSKYMNIVQNDRAYSLPGQDYANNINFDTSIARCTAKGENWHMTTRLEWMAVALWCLKNGTLPKGNNDYGKDHSETTYKAIPMTKDANGKTLHVAGGTGPLTWSHNGQQDGIWDLNGNGYEWVGGVRTVYGELQVLSKDGTTFGNDAADPDNSQAANSSLWYAIDGTDGSLIVPNGSGTTTNSLKIDNISGTPKWITGALSNQSTTYFGNTLESVQIDSTVCDAAKHILQALGFYKPDYISAGALGGDYVYFNNGEAERTFCCGSYYYSSGAGVFYAYGYNSRSNAGTYISFRSAYVTLPTA